jgi:hypothetical protein
LKIPEIDTDRLDRNTVRVDEPVRLPRVVALDQLPDLRHDHGCEVPRRLSDPVHDRTNDDSQK